MEKDLFSWSLLVASFRTAAMDSALVASPPCASAVGVDFSQGITKRDPKANEGSVAFQTCLQAPTQFYLCGRRRPRHEEEPIRSHRRD